MDCIVFSYEFLLIGDMYWAERFLNLQITTKGYRALCVKEVI